MMITATITYLIQSQSYVTITIAMANYFKLYKNKITTFKTGYSLLTREMFLYLALFSTREAFFGIYYIHHSLHAGSFE